MSEADDMDLWADMMDATARKTVVIQEGQQVVMDSDHYCGRPVIGKIVVLPKASLLGFECDKPWSCISILDSNLEAPKRYPTISEVNRVGLLSLFFDDIIRPKDYAKLFTYEQAEEVWKFVSETWERSEVLMIHCTAGISRSTAIAKAIAMIYQDKETAKLFDQLYSPNYVVYQRMANKYVAMQEAQSGGLNGNHDLDEDTEVFSTDPA